MKLLIKFTQLILTFFSLCVFFVPATLSEENIGLDKSINKIQLSSDQFKIDGKTGIFEQCGHASLVQAGLTLSAECITGKQNKDGTYAYIIASGNPATLTQVNLKKQDKLIVKASRIEYRVPKEQFIISGNGELELTNQQQDNVIISAEKINLDNRQPLNRDIHATGKPIQIEVFKSGESDLKAKSKNLHFNTGSYNLKLSKDVVANLAQKQISAGVFNYNSKTEVSSFEKPKDKQIEIIQTKKQP